MSLNVGDVDVYLIELYQGLRLKERKLRALLSPPAVEPHRHHHQYQSSEQIICQRINHVGTGTRFVCDGGMRCKCQWEAGTLCGALRITLKKIVDGDYLKNCRQQPLMREKVPFCVAKNRLFRQCLPMHDSAIASAGEIPGACQGVWLPAIATAPVQLAAAHLLSRETAAA